MPIGVRVFLGYILIVGLAVFFLVKVFVNEIKPGVRQTTEETLVDTANLLAELLAAEVRDGTVATGRFKESMDASVRRSINARIGGFTKAGTSYRIYVTDARGIVLYDSDGKAEGADYSRWNDVYLTLRGRYGARSTREDPSDERSSVMYVAAPIRDGEKIVGVVTIAKANRSVEPFIAAGRSHLLRAGVVLALLSLGVGIAFSIWMSRSVQEVVRYAGDLTAGKRIVEPRLRGELQQIGRAVTELREKLDGKTYVEEYIHAFMHELKSPLAAIYGAAELLEGEMPASERARFLQNIQTECQRLRQILDRLLDLARVEQRQSLETRVKVAVADLTSELRVANAALLSAGELAFVDRLPPGLAVMGDPFLLRQALNNLMDNAIQFSPPGGTITWSGDVSNGRVRLRLHNTGSHIPEFAAGRLFERFYSLPRPGTQKKSTGLGLAFAKEVALLHGGELTVENATEGGVAAILILPAD
ncbi:MAG TPA: two-component system sensor histidine kinase CreC [Candidatus Polarisedimenticolaceae bacterium]|nr:two-component system sensor histidine kinase CreC [Candidatus Polarisedimenticolaceae bacterium]